MRPPPQRVAARDSAVALAREAIAEGRPWRATRVLAPILRDSSLRTPEVELVAATAAAGWHGWREADQLLRNASWLDTAYDGEGRELLARAALGLGRDSNAVVQARVAVRLAVDPVARGERLVLLGQALEGTGSYDSASAGYRAAADLLPLVRDWLFLRAVGTATNPSSRAMLAGSITDTVIRSRLPLATALAVARVGGHAGCDRRLHRGRRVPAGVPAARGDRRQRAAPGTRRRTRGLHRGAQRFGARAERRAPPRQPAAAAHGEPAAHGRAERGTLGSARPRVGCLCRGVRGIGGQHRGPLRVG